MQQKALRNKLSYLKSKAEKVEEVGRALTTALSPKPGRLLSRAGSQEFALKYIENANQSPAVRPSYSLLSRNLEEYQQDPKLEANVCDAVGQMLSVNGFCIKSNFSVHLKIKIENRGMFGNKLEEHTRDFPIFIRSKTLKDAPVADVEQLGLLPLTLTRNVQKLKTHFGFIENPLVLPGCATAYDQLKVTREFIQNILAASTK